MDGAGNVGACRRGAVPIAVKQLDRNVEACACAKRARAAAAASLAAAWHAVADQKMGREPGKDPAISIEA